MIPEPQAAASKANAGTAPIVRHARVSRWPVLFGLALAIGVSLLLWAGIFAVIGAAGDLVNGAVGPR